MDLTILLYGLLPILVFAVADMMGNPRWGFVLATLLAAGETYWMYTQFGRVDPVSVVALVTIVALGAMTLKSRNSIFYKLQPTIVGAAAAAFLTYTQFVGPSIMDRYGAAMQAIMPEPQARLLSDPAFLAYFDRLFSVLIPIFLVHGVWMAWTAYKSTTWRWILVRGLGFWAMAVPVVFLMAVVSGP